MKNINKKQKGFTLPEVIVSIAIIVIVIVTSTNLLVSSIRANNSNINRIVAFNLAQEAIEGFRNIRDGNWMHNQYWRGSEKELFGVPFINDGNYVIKKAENLRSADYCSNEPAEVKTAAPWQLINYSEEASRLYLSSTESVKYLHETTGEQSKFRRWIEVQTLPYDLVDKENENKLKLSVTAVVEWNEGTNTKEFRLPAILTNWKAGPL